MVSTIDDYLAFGQMMLKNGKCCSERVPSRPSVETMTTDQRTPEQKAVSGLFPGFWDSRGWEFGVSTVTRTDDVAAIPGQCGWDGGYGTSWCSDPKEDIVATLMTQRLGFPRSSDIYLDYWTLAYQTIDDSRSSLRVTSAIGSFGMRANRETRRFRHGGSGALKPPAHARARSRGNSRSRGLRARDAARWNSGRASSKRPSFLRRSPRALGKRW
jgi:CubicO group peptidase (beta-lactamase class C family)